ncbi:class I SAM-dependent methyltransferase [Fluviicola taffensis]|uniref:Methyltransferase type 12 n=1 Tax=Fluviicola taffensis (strain DSM 16823 / NCIMB 13979 / RW262) TaxID=755732 RepID=F2IF53_FLUTR|nr:class I SAM-dependent methyltransferase [Fluviicola taffensis]AEA43527.1 Methyltransferase type 12 [Fluviicola taffensis DSM 16823]
MEHLNQSICPACGASSLSTYLTVTDHFLSKENFNLDLCSSCHLLFTNPRPTIDHISDYYKSEDYVSHSSTKKGFVNKVYGWVRSYTLKKKIALLKQLTDGKQLLDIGAGTGHFLTKAKQSGYSVLGLEPDEDARKVALSENGIELKDLSLLHELNQSFDIISMWHVLEHVYNLQADLDKIVSLVNQGGVLIIAVPNYTSFDAQYYKEFWAAYDVPRHLYHFSPKSIIPLVESKGLKFEKMLPMKFDSYYVSMLSEKYKGGSMLKAMRIGFLSNQKSKEGLSSSQIYIFRKK